MKLRGNVVVLCHEGGRLSAVWGTVQKERVRVKGWLAAEQPSKVDSADRDAVGEWVSSALKEAGCNAKACVVAVPRASVVLKRLTLPAVSGGREGDLAGMVQLQMSRQLTMPLQGAAIDYVRLNTPSGAEAEKPATELLAAALPGDFVANAQGLAKKAKLRLRSVALRGEGSATLFAQLSYTQDGPVLGVTVTSQGVELGIVAEGRVVFSRAVEISPPTELDGWAGFIQRVAVEAKRTRVGYRGTGESRDIACIAVLGDDTLAESVGKSLGDELGLPWQTVRFPNAVELPSEMENQTRAMLAPLIGLMVGAAIDRPTYDFSNPRKAPDTSAQFRQAALAAVFGFIIFGGGGWVIADQQLRSLDSKVAAAKKQSGTLATQYIRQLRTEARVNHIDKIREPNVDWIDHVQYLSQTLPPAELARLEGLTGVGRSAVAFLAPGEGGTYSEAQSLQTGQWVTSGGANFTIAGAATREVADELRADLVADNVYELSTRGADVAGKFEYLLKASGKKPATAIEGGAEGAPEAQSDTQTGAEPAGTGGAS